MSTKHITKTPLDISDERLYALADLFKVFGDSTRLRIICCLFSCERCVQHIAEELHMNQSAISHQLRLLRDRSLVSAHRDGQRVIYALADDHIGLLIGIGLEHAAEEVL